MKILVCGGRDYEDIQAVRRELGKVNNTNLVECVIHGGARGADTLAGQWAREQHIQEVICPANWEAHGKRAGYIRNAAMLYLQPDLVVAFPGGRGTEMMVKLAKEAGLEIISVCG